MIKTLILAGGQGSRLKEVAGSTPKPMMPVAGKPFLEHLVAKLRFFGLMDIVIAVGYQAHVIQDYFGDGQRFGVKIAYSTEADPLGTGGAIKNAQNLLDGQRFFVLNGDSYLDFNYKQAVYEHETNNAMATLALASVPDTSRYGSIKISPVKQIMAFTEKNQQGPGLINGGIYLFEREIFNYIEKGKISLENDVIVTLIGNRLYGVVTDGYFIDIGIPKDYLELANNPELINGRGSI